MPKDEEEMYFFALSRVLRLNRLPRSTQASAQIHILKYLTDLEKQEEDSHKQHSQQDQQGRDAETERRRSQWVTEKNYRHNIESIIIDFDS